MFTEKLYFSLSPSEKLAFWCQKVLPQVYDDSLSYVEVLYKVQAYLNELASNMDTVNDAVTQTASAFNDLVDYVNNYFETVDLSDAIRENIEQEISAGVFDQLIEQFLDNVDLTQLNIPTYYNDDMNVNYSTTDNLVRFIPNEFRQGNSPLHPSNPVGTAVMSMTGIRCDNRVGDTIYLCADKSGIIRNVTVYFLNEAFDAYVTPSINIGGDTTNISGTIPEGAYWMYIIISTGGTGVPLNPTELNMLYPKIYVGFSPVTDVSGIYHYRVVPEEEQPSVLEYQIVTDDMNIEYPITDNMVKFIPFEYRQGNSPLNPSSAVATGCIQNDFIDVEALRGRSIYLCADKSGIIRNVVVYFIDENKSNVISQYGIGGNTEYGSTVVPNTAKYMCICITTGQTGVLLSPDQLLKLYPKVYVGITDVQQKYFIYHYRRKPVTDWSLVNKNLFIGYASSRFGASENFDTSALIDVKEGDVINVSAYGTVNSASCLTFYSGLTPLDGTPIESTRAVNPETEVFATFIAPSDGYVAWSTRKDSITKSYFAINEPWHNLPPYWFEHVKRKEAEISIAKNGISNALEFIFITDVHWALNAKHSGDIINRLADVFGTQLCVFGGDAIATHTASKNTGILQLADWRKSINRLPVMCANGNHDQNQNGQTDSDALLTLQETYNAMYKNSEKYVENDGVVTSVYRDEVNKCVYISFDYWGAQDTENAINAMGDIIDEIDSSYYIVVFCHSVLVPDATLDPLNFNTLGASILALLGDKKTQGKKILLLMTGHTHKDQTRFDSGVAFTSSNCDVWKQSTMWGGVEMTVGTTTEQSFEYVVIDPVNNIANLIKIGAGNSRKINLLTGALIQ